MPANTTRTQPGFTLLEMVISLALGTMVLGIMFQLFKQGIDTTFLVNQRSENQQNMRAAIDLLNKDLSMAGAGLPPGGFQLPTGGGAVASNFGCDQTTCYVSTHTFPNGNYLTAIIPNFNRGVQGNVAIPAASTLRNDSITVVYADYNFPLFQYNIVGPPPFALPTINLTPKDPANPPPAVNAAGGLQVGDVVMLSNNLGTALGEVTATTTSSFTLAANDALQLNQNAAGISNNVRAITGGTNTSLYRLFIVTYFLQVPGAGQTPRLMRQVNGLSPVPVADNIINMRFAYDIYNQDTNQLRPNEPNPIGNALQLNLIQKINVQMMGQSMLAGSKKSQSLYLTTSVSARNMSYKDPYQ